MVFSFLIKNWSAISSGLLNKVDWFEWSHHSSYDWSLPLPKMERIPFMHARRMSISSRLAVEVGLTLIENETVDFAIFVSRHGELDRSTKILTTLNQNKDISPTDFTLSVHNSAAGLLSIIANKTIPTTSIAAKEDGFQQALLEAASLLKQGYQRILIIDFDSIPPELYQYTAPIVPAYAVGFVVTEGYGELSCQAVAKDKNLTYQNNYPQSMAFLHGYLSQQPQFKISGNFQDWQWSRDNL